MILFIIISIILRFTVSDIPTVAITVLKFTIYCLPFKIIFLDQSFIFIIIRVVLVFITEVLIFWHSEWLWASSLMLNMVFVFKIFFWGRRMVFKLAFCNIHIWIWRLSKVFFLRLLRVLFVVLTLFRGSAFLFRFFLLVRVFWFGIISLGIFLLLRILLFILSPRWLLLFIFLKWAWWLWISKTSGCFYMF